jgi:hypothetical protein
MCPEFAQDPHATPVETLITKATLLRDAQERVLRNGEHVVYTSGGPWQLPSDHLRLEIYKVNSQLLNSGQIDRARDLFPLLNAPPTEAPTAPQPLSFEAFSVRDIDYQV